MNTKPELDYNDHAEWCGMIIKRKADFPRSDGNKEGYVVTERGCNVMPGATWFATVAQAKKGIAAYKLACLIAPTERERGDVFWWLWELNKKDA